MIVVIGESIVDRVTGPAGGVTARPGGSPANVAVGLGRLGERVALVAELGRDSNAELVTRHLRGSDVELMAQYVEKTSTATALIDDVGAATYAFDINWTLQPVALPTPCDLVHVGSLAAVMAPGAAAVTAMLDRLGPGTVVSYDPNIRNVGQPLEVAAVEQIVGRAHLVKASDEDLAGLYPGVPICTVAARWLTMGPGLVVVTSGAGGSTAYAGDVELHQPARPVEVVDTVGAGDAFMAALLHALGRTGWMEPGRDDLGSALEFAARAAAIVCGREGADPAWSSEI